MRSSLTCAAFAVSALTGLSAAAPAFAEPAQTLTQRVSIAGLDLHTADGRAALHHRIVVAARKVCGATDAWGQVNDTAESNCVTDAERTATARATLATNAMVAGAGR